MKHRSNKGAVILLTALCLSLLGGCASQEHYEKVEKQALKYYMGKYDLKA